MSGWAFAQLRAFVAYKAKRAGVAVRLVDPRTLVAKASRREGTP